MSEDKKYAELNGEPREVYDLKDIEIFNTGTWNGDKYTTDDFDDIVNNFDPTKSILKPNLKLGHDKNQKILQKDGFPAAAWITSVKRNGEKLLCDLTSMPKKIYDLIKMKAYGRFSPEIIWNLQHGDVKRKRVLKGLALLGGDTPACQTTDDFINLYEMEENQFKEYMVDDDKIIVECIKNYDVVETEEIKTQEDSNMEDLKVKEYNDKIESLSKELEESKKANSEKDVLLVNAQKEYSELSQNSKIVEVDKYLQSKVVDGVISPAQVPYYTSLSIDLEANEDGVKVYSYAEKDEKKEIKFSNNFELVKSIIDNNGKQVDYSETSQVGKDKPETKEVIEDEKEYADEEAVKTYMEENKVSYKEALIEVSKSDGGK